MRRSAACVWEDSVTDRDLKKLKRQDLLKMLLDTEEENRLLREDLDKARQQLDSRRVAISESGNLAEAALRLSGVFEDAQHAAEIYVHNIEQSCREQEQKTREIEEETRQRIAQAEEQCGRMEQECRERCESMIAEAGRRAAQYEENVRLWIREYLKKHPELLDAFDKHEKDGTEGSAVG